MSFLRTCIIVFALLGIVLAADQTHPLNFVNPFIGTEGSVPGTAFNGGNVFPGASLPFGAVKVSLVDLSAQTYPDYLFELQVGIDTTT